MSLYYNIDNYSLQEIDDNIVEQWKLSDNPKHNYYIKAPDKPSDNAVWNNGSWSIPPISIPSSISARQVRIWLIQNNINLLQVETAISNISDPITREVIRVEWEYAPYIERNHPMLIPLAQSLGLSESDIDRAFMEAANI